MSALAKPVVTILLSTRSHITGGSSEGHSALVEMAFVLFSAYVVCLRGLLMRPQACSRFAGKFDWLAIGDDDTIFMLDRARKVLKLLDHNEVTMYSGERTCRRMRGTPDRRSGEGRHCNDRT